jgi:hypothetical protein
MSCCAAPTTVRGPTTRVLPGEATVRFVSALGAKAWVELSYEGRLVEAEITRENLAKLEISRGKRCNPPRAPQAPER